MSSLFMICSASPFLTMTGELVASSALIKLLRLGVEDIFLMLVKTEFEQDREASDEVDGDGGTRGFVEVVVAVLNCEATDALCLMLPASTRSTESSSLMIIASLAMMDDTSAHFEVLQNNDREFLQAQIAYKHIFCCVRNCLVSSASEDANLLGGAKVQDCWPA